MSYWRYPRYVSVGEKRAKALKKLKQLRKKNPNIEPVVIEGGALAKTWWGKAWNNNLERYADYANRIGRGRSYVRHRAVLDLRIEPGKVTALVQGSQARPYSVSIKIRELSKKTWKEVTTACSGKFKSLQDLLIGKFPKTLSEIFMARGTGLFPSPKEIDFDCSCPDWAYMCKHVAASLYGIGARFDEDPSLFFKLRKAKMDDLVTKAMKETTGKLLEKAEKKRERVIADTDLEDVFGIIMEDQVDFGTKGATRTRSMDLRAHQTTKRGKSGVPDEKRNLATPDARTRVLDIVKKSKSGISVSAIKKETNLAASRVRYIITRAMADGRIERISRGVYAVRKRRTTPITASDAVLKIIEKSRSGIEFPQLREKSGLDEKKLRNIIFRLTRLKKIKSIRRGVYTAIKKK